MDRRQFVSKFARIAPALGLLPIACGKAGKKVDPDQSILIIGAGVAGLGAAERLRSVGIKDITFLEARDRVGGRVWTSNEWKDVPVDLGASWIHGVRGNPIIKIAREAGAKMAPTDYENLFRYGANGNGLSDSESKAVDRIGEKLYRMLLNPPSEEAEVSLREAIERTFKDASVNEKKQLDFVINSLVEHELAEDAENLSSKAYSIGDTFGGNDVLFPDGYGEIFAPRYEPFSIKTAHVVSRVIQKSSEVVVETDQGSFSADRVIVTLPLGVLKRDVIEFEPGLPAEKQEAIERLGMGCLNKVYLQFPERFWPVGYDGFNFLSNDPGQWSEWLDFHHYTEQPVLLAFNAGSFGREIEMWSDDEVINDAMRVLRTIHGNAIPEPDSCQITRWASDSLSFGSYSCLAVGATEKHIAQLGAPVGDCIFFAGEATSVDYPSTVHGAYLSGIREAERIASLG